MRALASTGLLVCACATTAPAPKDAALEVPKGRLELAARLAGPSERESFPDPAELGPYVRASRLHAADSAAESELDAAFPGCSLSAWELDTCGTIPGDPKRFALSLVEGRTRLSLARTDVPIGGKRLRLLVAIAFDHTPAGNLVLAFTVYRIEPASLDPLLHCTIDDAPARALSVMPCGMENASGWRTLYVDLKRQVIQCWCTPERILDGAAAHQYETRSIEGFFMTGGSVEHAELLSLPLEQWPEPVWMLTLVPADP
jgi:hypothetical protein